MGFDELHSHSPFHPRNPPARVAVCLRGMLMT